MMRRRSLLLAGLIAFLLFLVALMPARLAVHFIGGGKMLHFGVAEGTIWQATIRDVYWNGIPLGNVRLKPGLLAMFTGGFSGHVAFDHKDRNGRALLSANSGLKITGLSAITNIYAVVGQQALSGSLQISAPQFSFDSAGRCVSGNAKIRSDILNQAFLRLGFDLPVLEGTADCQNGELEFRFETGDDNIRILGNGQWRGGARIEASFALHFLQTADISKAMIETLEYAGLRAAADGWQGHLNLDLK